jgi:acyl-CoA reductase-like NAD-dependent aldehyde dehydrogenase
MAVAAEAIHGLFVDGTWATGGGEAREIRSPYDGALQATVHDATPEEVDLAIAAAAQAMESPLTPNERFEILSRAADLIADRAEQLARTITGELGKTIRDARGEVRRSEQTMRLAAEEAKRLAGEVVPLGATPGSEHRLGFTLRDPVGPVAAITPFNGPLVTVNHKVPTALAAGCSTVLKPSENTPISAIRQVEILAEAGLPAGWVNLVLGGRPVGEQLVADPRFGAYTFTGSVQAGKAIRREAGLRKVVLELGNSSPTIVCGDADLAHAARSIGGTAYAMAGQLCVSPQRALVQRAVFDDFVERLVTHVRGLKLGDPFDETTDVGPMITEDAAVRAERAVQSAVAEGARVLVGGKRTGTMFEPTILVDTRPDMAIVCEEVFAPVLSVMPYDKLREACEQANGTPYGLMCSVFTESADVAFHLAKSIRMGTVVVNEGPFRVDQMPFGGVKDSGLGREGVRYTVEEFTDERLVSFALRPPE